jgi:hypothetical protein
MTLIGKYSMTFLFTGDKTKTNGDPIVGMCDIY